MVLWMAEGVLATVIMAIVACPPLFPQTISPETAMPSICSLVFVPFFAIGIVVSSLRLDGNEFAANKPNIIIIYVDDLGYADIGPFWATKQKTPNLDRMAEEGMKLTSFYAAPVCSVSRAQLLTGCYGARVSVPGVYGPAQKTDFIPMK